MRWRVLECHGRYSTIAMLSGLVVLLALVNVQLLTGVRHVTWDADGFFAPAQMLVADFAQAGRLLLWNPWTNAGSPDGCDPQYGAFSPICVAFGFLTGGTESGFNLYWLFIWLLGGVGMLFLTRSLNAPPWGCFLASASFMLSGFYTGHASHTSFIHAWSFLPWIIWRWDVSLRTRSFMAATQAGAIWGLSALAGYPGIVVANGGMVLFWAIGRIACSMPSSPAETASTAFECDRGPGNRLSHGIFGCAAIALLVATGLVVLSPTYVGFLKETAGFSSRSGPYAARGRGRIKRIASGGAGVTRQSACGETSIGILGGRRRDFDQRVCGCCACLARRACSGTPAARSLALVAGRVGVTGNRMRDGTCPAHPWVAL